jgi:integration host factor subunit beta
MSVIGSDSINKASLLEKLIELNPEIDPSRIEKALETIFDEVSMALICGDRVELRGFGSLVVRKRGKGEKRNPKSGSKVQVSDRGSLYFRASRDLIKSLNTSASNDN